MADIEELGTTYLTPQSSNHPNFKHYQSNTVVLDELIIPDIQRALDESHVNEIYEFQRAHYTQTRSFCLSGTISIVVIGDEQFLVDGQHRVEAYKRLRAEYPAAPMNLTVDYYEVETEAQLEQIYEIVNRQKINPITKLGIDKYKVYKEFSEYLQATFGSYCKTSASPQRPNINVERMIERMEELGFMRLLGGDQTSSITAALIELFEDFNNYYSTTTEKQFKAWGVSKYNSTVAKIKRRPSEFYLGLYRQMEYLDRMVDVLKGDADVPVAERIAALNHISSTFRPKIPKKLRRKVWGCDKTEQECYCCGDEIEIDDFECGHVVAVAHGGATTVDNLRPICSTCNGDMGVENLEVYRQRFH